MANSIIAYVPLISSKLTPVIYYYAGSGGPAVYCVGMRSPIC
jgi:hypothetical protein